MSDDKKTIIGLFAFVLALVAVLGALMFGLSHAEKEKGTDGKPKCHCNTKQQPIKP